MTIAKMVFFPLDRQLGVADRNWSESIIREMNWLSGVADSYERAEEIMQRIGRIEMSDSTIWRHVKSRGGLLQAAAEKRQAKAMALPKVGERPRQPAAGADRMGVGMDGGMVHIVGEGWKEFKVGTVFAIEQRLTHVPESDEWVELAHAHNSSYVAHLGDAQAFGPLIWSEAQARAWEDARHTQTIGDGAQWIWNLADEHFPLSIRTVDWYHATHYLHEAARLLYPGHTPSASRWYKRRETQLFQGHAQTIADAITDKIAHNPTLNCDELTATATYFRNNHQRMQYMELREDGFPIGSGMIESGVKQFKARFTGPGMRWSRSGFQRLLPIRAAVLSHAFDSLWDAVFPPPPN